MNMKRAGSGSTQHRDDSEGTREAVKKISNNKQNPVTVPPGRRTLPETRDRLSK